MCTIWQTSFTRTAEIRSAYISCSLDESKQMFDEKVEIFEPHLDTSLVTHETKTT